VFKGKTLLFVEESLTHWLLEGGAIPVLLPTVGGPFAAADLVAGVDALVLQGGADVAPASYRETPLRPEWSGDKVRDDYETALLHAALAQGRPVLGVCRGLQLINVALGGSLLQDIATQRPGALLHREFERYDDLQHDVRFEDGSWLALAYRRAGGRVNTVHHQAIDRLAPRLKVEARAVPDGVIEAARYEPGGPGEPPFVYGVQWHPEFQDPDDAALLPTAPLRDMLCNAARARRDRGD
jgi:putative glutamine amidotransferase